MRVYIILKWFIARFVIGDLWSLWLSMLKFFMFLWKPEILLVQVFDEMKYRLNWQHFIEIFTVSFDQVNFFYYLFLVSTNF